MYSFYIVGGRKLSSEAPPLLSPFRRPVWAIAVSTHVAEP